MAHNSMKTIYIVIRVPKSGSQTLSNLMRQSLPESNRHPLPRLDIDFDMDKGIIPFLRRQRMTLRSIYREYGALNVQAMCRQCGII